MPELKTVKKYSNYRVVVVVRVARWLVKDQTSAQALNEARSKAKDIIGHIKRHVDIPGDLYFTFDTQVVCAYCGAEMEGAISDGALADAPAGCPVCCMKAQDEWLAALGIDAKV